MPSALRKLFLLHARKLGFESKVQSALSIIKRFLDKRTNPYISVSGGKDSSVLLHLCRSVNSNLDAVYFDMNATYPESDELLGTYPNLHRIVVLDRLSEIRSVGMRGKKSRVVDELSEDQVAMYDGHFYGLRAEESAGRRMLAGVRGPIFYRKTDCKWVCQPLYNWSYDDVWAYIVQEDIPYNSLYDLMWDRPKHAQRVASFTLSRSVNLGTVAYLKQTHPHLYNIIVQCSDEYKEFV